MFLCDHRLQVRTKIHGSKNKKGFCNLSVTIVSHPKNINSLVNSPYSLDHHTTLPNNLIYDNNQDNS